MATHPIHLWEYQLLPQTSVLNVSGGFAGINESHSVGGSISLFVDPRAHEPNDPDAGFVDVSARIEDESLALDADLDTNLQMTEWVGAIIDPQLVSFAGRDFQAAVTISLVELTEDTLAISGRNQAPCCDYFDLQWEIYGRRITPGGQVPAKLSLGDFNADGLVGQGDLDLLLLNWGSLQRPRGWIHNLPGDKVDQQELDQVLVHWGARSELPPAPSVATAAVPEPATLGIIFVLFALRAFMRIWRQPRHD